MEDLRADIMHTPIEQEKSPEAVHSEPAVTLNSKFANLNLADIKPFYPRSERVLQEERESEQHKKMLDRGAYADVVGRNTAPVPTPHADRVIRITEQELLEEQRRMKHHGLLESYMQNRPVGEELSRGRVGEPVHAPAADTLWGSRYASGFDEHRAQRQHKHHVSSPRLRGLDYRPSRPTSGMELLEKNLEQRRHEPAYFDRTPGRRIAATSPRLPPRSSFDRSEFELWSDYKLENSRRAASAAVRDRSYYSHGGHLSLPPTAELPPLPPRVPAVRHASSRLRQRPPPPSQSSNPHYYDVDYDLQLYENLCKSDPIYEDPTQDNEFFMYQMMAAEENAKREKLCGLSPIVPPDQVAKASAPKKETQKSRICRHFLRGHCKFGESCNFFHGAPLVHASDQLVFLGGLPTGITSDMLVNELNRQYGVEVLNKPQIFSNFSPRVALSLDDAKLLKGHGKINIFTRQVDVRAFEDNSKSEAEKCMVFLGGLPEGIKLTELISQLRKKGIQVMNKPYLGDGYARNVQVQSEKHANDLIRKRKIFLFSSSVDVRPYVNVYGKKKDEDIGMVIPIPPPRTTNPTNATNTNTTAATEDDATNDSAPHEDTVADSSTTTPAADAAVPAEDTASSSPTDAKPTVDEN